MRRQLMAKVRSKDSKPELAVRKAAHALGFRFRLHRRDLPGSPDIVFPRLRKVVFVHGCFWHRHDGCSRKTMPRTREEFWTKKFQANIARDRRNLQDLEALGWDCKVIWECEAQDRGRLKAMLLSFLGDNPL
ncbi:MAG: DNA mismatch endonuclease Vsr [Roseitalea porphyridii]|jgi:DNA mismatch endonuclease (patch repair protein)|uniref:very short patch repair endonuclease n=1 Tax=Roseitalea porphyridii TaxID=1852022 RepID=UPI0032ECC18A